MFKDWRRNKLIFLSFFVFSLLFTFQANAIEIAITVDDLPTAGKLPPGTTRLDVAKEMLAVFAKHHIQGVYGFINGTSANAEGMQILKLWVAKGQLLGNHTFSHLDLAQVSTQQYIADIKRNNSILSALMANKDYKYFRYPYLSAGDTAQKRNNVRNFLFTNNYKIAEDSFDFYDYSWNNPYVRCTIKHDKKAISWLENSFIDQSVKAVQVSQNFSQSLFNRNIKYILLLHYRAFDAKMLDRLLTRYEQMGIKFIPLPEAMADNAYKTNPNIIAKTGYVFFDQLRLAKGQSPENKIKLLDGIQKKLLAICT